MHITERQRSKRGGGASLRGARHRMAQRRDRAKAEARRASQGAHDPRDRHRAQGVGARGRQEREGPQRLGSRYLQQGGGGSASSDFWISASGFEAALGLEAKPAPSHAVAAASYGAAIAISCRRSAIPCCCGAIPCRRSAIRCRRSKYSSGAEQAVSRSCSRRSRAGSSRWAASRACSWGACRTSSSTGCGSCRRVSPRRGQGGISGASAPRALRALGTALDRGRGLRALARWWARSRARRRRARTRQANFRNQTAPVASPAMMVVAVAVTAEKAALAQWVRRLAPV